MGTRWTTFRPTQQSRRGWGGRYLLLSGALCLGLLTCVASWFFLPRPTSISLAAPPRGGPRLVVDRDLIDFGTVPFDHVVQARFHVRNVGDQPLRLAEDPKVVAVEGC